jgi:hypothetical protein
LAALLFLTLWGIQIHFSRGITNGVATEGIVSLELAGTSEQTARIFESWGKPGLIQATIGLWFDFLFIISYVLVLSQTALWATAKVRAAVAASSGGIDAAPRVARLFLLPLSGFVLVIVAALAGLYDVGENICLLVQIGDGPCQLGSQGAFVFALAKFTLVGVCILYVLTGMGLGRIIRRN